MDHQPDVFALEPRSADILLVLARRGVLDARSAENDRSVAEGLYSILRSPRFAGADPRHIYWSTLERLYDPATNTQRIAVPFTEGSRRADTCVSAAIIGDIIERRPGEYVRLVEGLTSPAPAFTIARPYSRDATVRRIAWLRTFTQFDHLEHLGTDVLRIRIEPDVGAPARAVAEHAGRTFPEYSFGARDLKNTRLLVDVMVQSAFTNYAMAGLYDSRRDCDRRTGERGGVEYGSPGDTAMREDLGGLTGALAEIHPHTSLVYVGERTAEESMRAAQDAWTGGHYLDVPTTITIDE